MFIFQDSRPDTTKADALSVLVDVDKIGDAIVVLYNFHVKELKENKDWLYDVSERIEWSEGQYYDSLTKQLSRVGSSVSSIVKANIDFVDKLFFLLSDSGMINSEMVKKLAVGDILKIFKDSTDLLVRTQEAAYHNRIASMHKNYDDFY